MNPTLNPKFMATYTYISDNFQYWRNIRKNLLDMKHLEYPPQCWKIFDEELIPMLKDQAPWNNIKALFLKIESERLEWRYPREK